PSPQEHQGRRQGDNRNEGPEIVLEELRHGHHSERQRRKGGPERKQELDHLREHVPEEEHDQEAGEEEDKRRVCDGAEDSATNLLIELKPVAQVSEPHGKGG